MSERVLTITPERLSGLMRTGKGVVLVDVRSPAEYRAGHVPGATLLPLDELDVDRVMAKTGTTEIGADRTLYLTCHSGARAREAAERLLAAGRRNLAVVEGGTEAWARAGLPLRRCGAALTLQRQAQIAVGLLTALGSDNVIRAIVRPGAAMRRAVAEAEAWLGTSDPKSGDESRTH